MTFAVTIHVLQALNIHHKCVYRRRTFWRIWRQGRLQMSSYLYETKSKNWNYNSKLLAEYCVQVSEVPGRQHLRSARRHQLLVPRVRRGTFGTRAFSVAGPTVWNSLPECLRDPAVDSEQFGRDLKMYLFAGHLRR